MSPETPYRSALSSLRRLVETTPLRPLTREGVAVAPRGRGLYVIIDPEEPDAGQLGVGRVVRIGVAERRTLRKRLSEHVGGADGGGDHRRSVFRRHVGWALARRDNRPEPTWTVKPAPAGARAIEAAAERAVSGFVRRHLVTWLETETHEDPAGDALSIESTLLGAFSRLASTEPPVPSSDWLGHWARNGRVCDSGLWNTDHVAAVSEPDALRQLSALVAARQSPAYNSGG